MKAFTLLLLFVLSLGHSTANTVDDLVWPRPTEYTSSAQVVPIQALPARAEVLLAPATGSPLRSELLRVARRRVRNAYRRTRAHFYKACTLLEDPSVDQVTPVVIAVVDWQSASEEYRLEIDPASGIHITGTGPNGALHALTTLRQLLQHADGITGDEDTCWLQKVMIRDQPRFQYRGFMLDTSRNFFPKEDIMRTIEGMAYTKLNVFHWHMLDSQSFPLLWDFMNWTLPINGAYRYDNGTMKVYTAQDVADIVRFAGNRGITVVPEFESPGHATVWGNAFPEMRTNWDGEDPKTGEMVNDWVRLYKWRGFILRGHTDRLSTDKSERFCAQPPCGQMNLGSQKTYMVFEAFLRDMAAWFPSSYWHLGFDEVNGKCWGTNDTGSMVEEFFGKIDEMMKPLQKQKIYWDEVVTEYDLQPNVNDTIIQAWHPGATKTATSMGYRTIVSSYEKLYLDCGPSAKWCAPYKSWSLIYGYDPTEGLSATEANLVLGATACLWTESIKRDILDPAAWPRLLALGEKLWSSKQATRGDPLRAHGRLAKHRAVLRSRFGIDASSLGFTGDYPQLYRPEWCDFNLGSPAAKGNPNYVPGNDTTDYCAPAYHYRTNDIVKPPVYPWH